MTAHSIFWDLAQSAALQLERTCGLTFGLFTSAKFNFDKMPKTAQLENYEVLTTIGTGTFGTCKKIRRKSDGKVLASCNI